MQLWANNLSWSTCIRTISSLFPELHYPQSISAPHVQGACVKPITCADLMQLRLQRSPWSHRSVHHFIISRRDSDPDPPQTHSNPDRSTARKTQTTSAYSRVVTIRCNSFSGSGIKLVSSFIQPSPNNTAACKSNGYNTKVRSSNSCSVLWIKLYLSEIMQKY